MKSLYIDTSSNNTEVILFEDEKILNRRERRNEKYNNKFLLTLIEEVLHDELPEEIIIVNGPGSFTGVRIGVTVAKTMAFCKNIPIKTISSLECVAASVETEEKIVGISDKNGYYVGIFDDNINLIGDYSYLSNLEFLEFSLKYKVITYVEFNYENIIKHSKKLEYTESHHVNPLYIKLIEAEK